MSLIIRAVDADEEHAAIEALHVATFGDTAPFPVERYEDTSWWLVFDKSPRNIPVAFAGAIESAWEKSAFYFCRVGVLPAYRGFGLQSRLMGVIEATAKRRGLRMVVSDTRDNIPSANNFIARDYRIYRPKQKWGRFSDTIYWRKELHGASA